MPLFKGYCNYFLEGRIKTHHFESYSLSQITILEQQLKNRPGVSFIGTHSTRDYQSEAAGKGVQALSSKSIRKVFKGE